MRFIVLCTLFFALSNAQLPKTAIQSQIPDIPKNIKELKLPQSSSPTTESSKSTPDKINILATDSTLEAPLEIKPKEEERFENTFFSAANTAIFSSTANLVGSDYPLKAGDKLVLSIWGGPDRDEEIAINSKGMVRIQDVGLVSVNGLTLAGAESKIIELLSKSTMGIKLGTTKVSLRISELSPIKVFILGEVKIPGGYVFQGNTNVFMALYQAKGISKIGSVRDVQVKRNGTVLHFDLYKYLLNGQRFSQSILKDGDIIFIPKASKIINISGAINKPSSYELKNGENIRNLIYFAGGLRPDAGSNPVQLVRRFTDDGREDFVNLKKATDCNSGKETRVLIHGDRVIIPISTERSRDFYSVEGLVKYPQRYQFTKGITLKQAIKNAGGLFPEALKDAIRIVRTSNDGFQQILSGSLDSAFSNTILNRADSIIVPNKNELIKNITVDLDGAISKPGKYDWNKGMTLKDLIVLGGGMKKNAWENHVILERTNLSESRITTLVLKINRNLLGSDASFQLQANDRINILEDTSYIEKAIIKVGGSVVNPGNYSLERKNESFKSFFNRIIRLDSNSYLPAATFSRKSQVVKTVRDTSGVAQVIVDTILQRININFESILAGKDRDITLQDGDDIFIPTRSLTVNVSGEVLSPGEILFNPKWDADDYLNGAGGLTLSGDEDRIVVTFANGEKSLINKVKRKIDPGSSIQVAFKKPPEEVSVSEELRSWASVIGGIASTITAIFVAYATISK